MRAEEAAAGFSGERLRLARFRAGLTVREVADRVDVSHAAISQYEIGRTRPAPAVLARLAIATGVSAGFFVFNRRPVSAGGLDGTHFRSLRSTSRAGRASAWAWSELVLDVAEVLERHVRLPDPVLPMRSLAPDAGGAELADAAEELRSVWRLPDGPVGHLVRQLEVHGILVARLAVADKGIDAFSHFQGARPVVILGSDKGDAARSRFDAAHELGHLVCHPDADPGGEQEQQANGFAAELLMPRAHMVRVLPRRFDLGAYARLKQEWGVSIAALLYRARGLEIIGDAAYRRAVMVMNRRYGRRSEPYPLEQPERPALLATASEVAARGGADLDRLAAECCLPLDDVRAIIGDPDPRPLVTV
jgi:Zn-dependent peptidase ImmA (M78 family)/transcriptional regulator with XRE-family HTH domain